MAYTTTLQFDNDELFTLDYQLLLAGEHIRQLLRVAEREKDESSGQARRYAQVLRLDAKNRQLREKLRPWL